MSNEFKFYIYLSEEIENLSILKKMLSLISKENIELIRKQHVFEVHGASIDGFNKIAVSIKPLLSDLKIDKLAFIITPSYYDEFLSFIDVNESKVYNLYDIILEKFYNQSLNIRLLTSIFDKIPDELLQTVYNYIKCNQSIVKTSDLMFTHRNTINYRINKFINMTNINVRELNNSMFVYFVISLINVRK